MWIEKIVLFFLFLFALFGATFVGIILHEYSHYNDFKGLNVTDNEICGIALPIKWTNLSDFMYSPIGYYSFRLNDSSPITYQKYTSIDKDTELKAYTITALVFVFFVICFLILASRDFKDKNKILEQEIDSLEDKLYIYQLDQVQILYYLVQYLDHIC